MTKRIIAVLGALSMVACTTSGEGLQRSSAAQASTSASQPSEALPDRATTAALFEQADHLMSETLAAERWSAFRNMLGGARAVLIYPNIDRAGFVVAGSSGVGILMARHGEDWSDPVFVRMKSASVGFQAGVEQMRMITIVMSDNGLRSILSGSTQMGGASSFTFADRGVGGGGSGSGLASGLEQVSISFSKGLAVGGGFQGAQISVEAAYNTALYGSAVSPDAILNRAPGHLPQTSGLRKTLSQAVRMAWHDR